MFKISQNEFLGDGGVVTEIEPKFEIDGVEIFLINADQGTVELIDQIQYYLNLTRRYKNFYIPPKLHHHC